MPRSSKLRWTLAMLAGIALAIALVMFYQNQRQKELEVSKSFRSKSAGMLGHTEICVDGVTYFYKYGTYRESLTPKWKIVEGKPTLIPCGEQ